MRVFDMETLPTVLIVDDELGVRESLRAILGPDYQVLTAGSGEEAIATCRRMPVDVVTLDLRMPGMGGITVLEAIKQIDSEIEVLIITGYGSFDTALQGLRHRAFDYLAKPFDCDHVRHVVQAALARRMALQRLRCAPDQILATLSHEFRTPLNVITGYSTMLADEEGAPLTEEQKLALDRIQANSSALLSYVETLFYMVEIDRGLVPVTAGPVHLSHVLTRVQHELQPTASSKGLVLRTEAPHDLVTLTDEDKLVRLVRALADNGVRYTQAGEIVVSARNEAGRIVIAVRDTGTGIAPELINETHEVIAARPNGEPPRLLGFGLRLVGRLVRTIGASLDIQSDGSGTTCTIRLPEAASGTMGIVSNG